MELAHGATIIHEASDWIGYGASLLASIVIVVGATAWVRRRAR